MADTNKLNKPLWTEITRLKLLSQQDASPRFILDKSPFDHDQTNASNVYVITGYIFPKSDVFKDYSIQIEMKLTPSYPLEPPEVRILTPLYHPNIDKNGKFCHALLMKTARWKSGTTLVEVVKIIVDYLDNPDIDYSINHEIGKEYMENRVEFDRKALETIKKHGLSRN